MNLIEAHKFNREGKFKSTSEARVIDFSKYGCLWDIIKYDIGNESELHADDWEIVKVPRKIVIENVIWTNHNGSALTHPEGSNIVSALSSVNNKKIPTKMTLEWMEE